MPRNPLIGLPLIDNSIKIFEVHKNKSEMVVASEFMKSVLIENGIDERKISVIPYFTYLPERRDSIIANKEPMILAVGRITREKGMAHILRAIAAIPITTKLVIVGDGPAINLLKELAGELRINSKVTFTGWLDHDKLYEYYERASLIVVPSLWPEPFGIVGIEAMAYSKPVLAYDVGGVRQWLGNGCTGILVERGNWNELADKILYLLKNPNLAAKMGLAGKEKVEKHFVPERHMEHLIELFEKAIKNFYRK
jgi:glycosyltransferase involved in cell wall biosynthesis